MMYSTASLLALAAAVSPAVAAPAARDAGKCGNFDTLPGSYLISNNVWGKGMTGSPQCISSSSNTADGVAWTATMNWQSAPTSGGPISYPNAAINVPKPVGVTDLKSVKTSAKWTFDGKYSADVSYDMFTVADPNNPKDKDLKADIEIMVWLSTEANGGLSPINPKSGTQSGQFAPPKATAVPLAGHSFDLYWGQDQYAETWTFKATENIAGSFDGDMNDFIQYLVKNQNYDTKQQLNNVEFGAEVFKTDGPATLTVSSFSGSVE